MDLNVTSLKGENSTSVDVDDGAFAAAYNPDLIHQIVVAYQAGARSGTRAQKNRSAVRGGGAKPWRQKGTGRARAGTIRSPIWRGGGRTFPASNKDFAQKVNRKMYRAGMRSIISELIRQNRIHVVDEIAFDKPATKDFAAVLSSVADRATGHVLVVCNEPNDATLLSARNLRHVELIAAAEVNPLSLVRSDNVILTVDAIKSIEERLQ